MQGVLSEFFTELVNTDPYGEGWLIKIKPAADADYDALLDAEGYKAVINE